ncbi:hypothetical protein [Kineococcus rhizosphaerae]|uniref:Uncharacterized protein n=1 Tax=Kineococcus rhizosphaerae TaxID=559628 RepID=A0A2T0R1I9_9ACTN|nr:hypothetical protein [Kineococcus rhizosphaerae]PRY13384.1 hypothetical protein CLV37_10852 [Kineococcus rhizosphaerae]
MSAGGLALRAARVGAGDGHLARAGRLHRVGARRLRWSCGRVEVSWDLSAVASAVVLDAGAARRWSEAGPVARPATGGARGRTAPAVLLLDRAGSVCAWVPLEAWSPLGWSAGPGAGAHALHLSGWDRLLRELRVPWTTVQEPRFEVPAVLTADGAVPRIAPELPARAEGAGPGRAQAWVVAAVVLTGTGGVLAGRLGPAAGTAATAVLALCAVALAVLDVVALRRWSRRRPPRPVVVRHAARGPGGSVLDTGDDLVVEQDGAWTCLPRSGPLRVASAWPERGGVHLLDADGCGLIRLRAEDFWPDGPAAAHRWCERAGLPRADRRPRSAAPPGGAPWHDPRHRPGRVRRGARGIVTAVLAAVVLGLLGAPWLLVALVAAPLPVAVAALRARHRRSGPVVQEIPAAARASLAPAGAPAGDHRRDVHRR